MKIGLSLAFKGQNYGQQLQAFATQYLIERMGHTTEIIDYTRKGLKGIRFTPWLAVYEFKMLKRKLENRLKSGSAELDSLHRENLNLRKKTAEEFRERYLHNIVKCDGNEQLFAAGKRYDAALVGSDQCWLPESCFGNLRTLRFVPDTVRKISYATSLGVSEYPLYCKSSAKQFLRKFDYISVREEQGKKIIEKLCDKRVEVVLDPTYLLSKEEWLRLIPPQREIETPYVLCFFIGNNKESKLAAADFAKKKGLKTVSILSDESVSEIDTSFADQIITGAGPERFVNLIRNAECVMTDSFHGVAFSVINEKQFYVFYRHAVSDSNSRNSRIDNILKTWGLRDRQITSKNADCLGQSDIDYRQVNKLLSAERKKSTEYLERALQ